MELFIIHMELLPSFKDAYTVSIFKSLSFFPVLYLKYKTILLNNMTYSKSFYNKLLNYYCVIYIFMCIKFLKLFPI